MTFADALRSKAAEYELRARARGDVAELGDRQAHLDAHVCLGVAITLRELANLEEEREAA